jgi:hypothetical protein
MLLSWDENDTWNSLGDGIQADFPDPEAEPVSDDSIDDAFGSVLEIDVTASLLAWQARENNHGWAILPDESALGDGWSFYTSEYTEPALRPTLVITPEPTTLCLFALGGLLLTRRRR